jgi:serine/threonine protein kinase
MLLELPGYAETTIYPERYTADSSQRYCNEVRVCNLLHHRGVGMGAFVGAYNSEKHPFGLVYEYLDGLDLKQYLRNEPYSKRLKLVRAPLHAFPINHLTLFKNS